MSSKQLTTGLDYSWAALREQVDGIDLSGVEDRGNGTQKHEGESEVLDNDAEQILVLVGTKRVEDEVRATYAVFMLDLKPIVAQYHLDRLVKMGFLEEDTSRGPDPTYGITRKGRAYVVESGLV